ncbi:MAG: hypothetical protein WBB73_09570 [Candidatus Aminicenantaceae bacterium]
MGANTMRSRLSMMTQLLIVLSVVCLKGLTPCLEALPAQDHLQDILARSAQYCEQLKNLALHFVCHEKITIDTCDYTQKTVWRKGRGGHAVQEIDLRLKRRGQADYLYDYQLIRRGKENQEKRILLRENGKAVYHEDAELPYQRFWSEFLVYGPVGFLSEFWQPFFEYQIAGREKLQDRDALLIRASPNSPRRINHNYGTIWMDEKDCRILKIMWDPRSISDFSSRVPTDAGSELLRELEWHVEYGVEKNGILFPSCQVIQEVLVSSTGRRYPKYTVTVQYTNYKFFMVETEVKY